ncbi:MAG: hypothetical protein RLZZ584_756 [Pseudomonadota bacterium]|jgi:hypothetical protein
MSTLSASFRHSSEGSRALHTLGQEVLAFVQAILQPGRIIREVEQMRALQVQAARIEADDPARAAELRRRAARIGLR